MTARKKASVQGARRVTANLDNLASLMQGHAASLGISEKVAADFAHRCDLLSDAIERNFGIKNAAYYNPAQIGEQVPGPLMMDANNPFMNGEFTQEKFTQLAEKQMSGSLAANAAAHVADPRLAALVAKEAAKLAFTVLKDRAAKKASESEEEEEEPKKEAKKSEDDDGDPEEAESKEAAAAFGLFAAK